MSIIGFKAFDKNLRCNGFQYKVGHTYTFDGEPIPCKQGFHFCKTIAETYNYYPADDRTRICKVEAIGDIRQADGEREKYCTNVIRICEEITVDWERKGNCNSSSSGYCNTGDHNSGDYNSGNYNTGRCNTGNYNSGDYNSGNYNTGSCNTGNYNSGNCNTGNCNSGNNNTGYVNSGNNNTGDWNTGDHNTGCHNIGHLNSGNYNIGGWNSGNCNTGDWNNTDNSFGCFNTKGTPMMMFNKPTEWTIDQWRDSEAFYILRNIPSNVVWISEEKMSDEEKKEHPSYKTTFGYLKVLDRKTVNQKYWDGLSERDKEAIYNLPNFDKDIFKECTGIDV